VSSFDISAADSRPGLFPLSTPTRTHTHIVITK